MEKLHHKSQPGRTTAASAAITHIAAAKQQQKSEAAQLPSSIKAVEAKLVLRHSLPPLHLPGTTEACRRIPNELREDTRRQRHYHHRLSFGNQTPHSISNHLPEVRLVLAALLLLAIFKTIFGGLCLVSTNQIDFTPSSRRAAAYEHFSHRLNWDAGPYLPQVWCVCKHKRWSKDR